MSEPGTGGPTVSLALAVTAAGAVAQVVGLAARAGAAPGSPRHDGGGALVVAGLVVVVAGLAGQLAPVASHLLVRSRRAAAALAVAGASLLLVAGIAIGNGLAAGGEPETVTAGEPSSTAPPSTAAVSSTASTAAGGSVGAAIAAQGWGTNTPPPSIEGVTFPSGGGRGSTGEGASWAPNPVLPVTVPPDTTPPAADDPATGTTAGDHSERSS